MDAVIVITIELYFKSIQIAGYIGKVDRQGRYYRHAAELLGFVLKHDNRAWTTGSGSHLLSLPPQEQQDYIRACVLNLRVFQLTVNKHENLLDGFGAYLLRKCAVLFE